MRTYYVFESQSSPGLRGFTETAAGEALPAQDGPWSLVRQVNPDDEWTIDISRAVVAAGILENGFFLSGPVNRPASPHPVIESDRVEGTPVFDRSDNRIGTIKRLLIEKVSGRVLSVDVTFGGFLGLGTRHLTVPWDKLTYAPGLGGYHTDVTEDQLRGTSALYGDDDVWPDRRRDREERGAERDFPTGPI
jgi:hypothetical protein